MATHAHARRTAPAGPRRRPILAAVILATSATLPTRAATDTWTGTTGSWSWGSNWSLGTAPAAGDTAYLTQADAINRTVSLDKSTPALGGLTIDATGAGRMTLSQTTYSYTLSAGSEYIGYSGSGQYIQTTGTNSSGLLLLGYNAGAMGTYSLSGAGTLRVTGEYIGYNGNGTLIQTGGLNMSTDNASFIEIGFAAGSSGTYILSGGAASAMSRVVVGRGGAGVLNISGTGSLTTPFLFKIWDTPGTAVNLAGGSLSVGTFSNSNPSRFNWTAGSLTVNNTLGTEVLGTSTTLSPAQSLTVGSFNLTTGTTFTLAGGSLTAGNLSRSSTNPGTFAWTAGALTVNYDLDASYLGTSTTFTPTHTLAVTGHFYIPAGTAVSLAGGSISAYEFAPTPGAFSWTAGTLSITGSGLYLGPKNLGTNVTLTPSQTLLLSGGNGLTIPAGASLTVAGATVANSSGFGTLVSGSLALSSGTFATTRLWLGDSTQAGTLTVSNGSLAVSGSLENSNGASTLSVSGGSVSISGSLNVPKLRFSGGTITAASLTGDPSGFNWTAGTLNLTSSTFAPTNLGPISTGKTLSIASTFAPSIGTSMTVNGGTFRVPAIDLTNNPGGLVWTSGTLAFNNVGYFTPFSNNIGTSFTLGPDKTLSFADSLSLPNGTTRRTLNLTGGRLEVGQSLSISGGLLTLSDGTVNVAGDESIYSASGAITQTGGTHAVAGSLSIGRSSVGSGAYTLSGGQVSAATISVGATSNGTAGTLTITGGSMTSAGNLRVHNYPGTSVTLSGGTLSLSSLNTSGNPANFRWTGGTLSFTASPPDISPTGPLGPSVTLSPNMTLRTTALPTIAPTSTLDITGGTLLVAYTGPSPADALRSLLLAGRITSSAADATHRLAYLDSATLSGEPTAPTSLTVTLALAGDTNLNGRIDPDDYTLLDRAYAKSMANPHWTDGDFNYDGQVTSADFLLVDTAYLQQQGGTPSPSLLAQRESQFGADYVSQLLTSVPEPSSLACLFAGLLPLTRRRTKP